MSIEEVIDFLKSKKKLYSQMDESGRKDYVMECLDTAINLLSNMTDGDLISRTELLNKIWQKEYGIDYDGVNLLNIPHIDIIEQMPSAEKTAEWISHEEDDLAINDYQCSKCSYWTEYNTKYCPNCGRKMKGA